MNKYNDPMSVVGQFIGLLIRTRHRAVSIRNDAQLTGDLESADKMLSDLFMEFDHEFYDIQHEFRSADRKE